MAYFSRLVTDLVGQGEVTRHDLHSLQGWLRSQSFNNALPDAGLRRLQDFIVPAGRSKAAREQGYRAIHPGLLGETFVVKLARCQ